MTEPTIKEMVREAATQTAATVADPKQVAEIAEDQKQVDQVLAQVDIRPATESVLRETEWRVVQDIARVSVKSKLTKWMSPEAAMVIIMTGRELGLGPMTALRLMHLIEGKVGLETQLMHALVLRRVPGARINFTERSERRAAVVCSRPNFDPREFDFTIEEARDAGLLHKSNWKYKKAMLSNRARAAACREYFPDACTGLWSVDELQDMAEDPQKIAEEIAQLKADIESVLPIVPVEEDIRIQVLDKARKTNDVEVLRVIMERAQTRIQEKADQDAAEAARKELAAQKVAESKSSSKSKIATMQREKEEGTSESKSPTDTTVEAV